MRAAMGCTTGTPRSCSSAATMPSASKPEPRILLPAVDHPGFAVRPEDHERRRALDADRVAALRGEIGDVPLVGRVAVLQLLPGALGQVQIDGRNADPRGHELDHFGERGIMRPRLDGADKAAPGRGAG